MRATSRETPRHMATLLPPEGFSGFVPENGTEVWIWEEFGMLFHSILRHWVALCLNYTRKMTFYCIRLTFHVTGQARHLLN